MLAFLQGAIAMASFVSALFFLRFWYETRDRFFVLFAVAFLLDAVTRTLIGLNPVPSEQDPIIYFGRLVTYGLILAAIVGKNRGQDAGL